MSEASTAACDLGRTRRGGDGGQVVAFTVVFMAALLLAAGIVVDGGLALAAKTRALTLAGEAARAAAQRIDATRYRTTGQLRLDPAAANAAAHAHLTGADATGSVTISGDTVTVTARLTQPAELLRLAGITEITVQGAATARPLPGVEQPEP